MNPRTHYPSLAARRGVAMLVAIGVILILGVIGSVVGTRLVDSRLDVSRSYDEIRAQRAADSALQLAIDRIQRVGSAREDERSCSGLDFPRSSCTAPPTFAKVNTVDSADGEWQVAVRGQSRIRRITATGRARQTTRTRTIDVPIVPRVFRYALFSGSGQMPPLGSYKTSSFAGGLVVSQSRVFLPPAPVDAPENRGGGLGSNGDLHFVGAQINTRGAGSQQQLYDELFVPAGRTANSNAAQFYGGTPWGTASVPRAVDAFNASDAPVTSFPSGTVNFDGPLRRLQTVTAFPSYETFLPGWRSRTDAERYSPSQFEALANAAAGRLDLTNRVVIIERPDLRDADCRIELRNTTVLLGSGALIVNACDLVIRGGGISIDRDMENANDPALELPAIMVLRDSDGRGGNLTFTNDSASVPLRVRIDGNVMAFGKLTWSGDGSDPRDGDLIINGSTIAVGGADLRGNATLIFNWHPYAQKMSFSTRDGEMGTYTVRSDDRLLTDEAPRIRITGKPAPKTAASDVTFSWAVTGGDADVVYCQMDSGPASPCVSPKTYDDLPAGEHRFRVIASNRAGQTADTYRFTVVRRLTLTIDDSSYPGQIAPGVTPRPSVSFTISDDNGPITDPLATCQWTFQPTNEQAPRQQVEEKCSGATSPPREDRDGDWTLIATVMDPDDPSPSSDTATIRVRTPLPRLRIAARAPTTSVPVTTASGTVYESWVVDDNESFTTVRCEIATVAVPCLNTTNGAPRRYPADSTGKLVAGRIRIAVGACADAAHTNYTLGDATVTTSGSGDSRVAVPLFGRTYTVTVTATNATGSDTVSFPVTLEPCPSSQELSVTPGSQCTTSEGCQYGLAPSVRVTSPGRANIPVSARCYTARITKPGPIVYEYFGVDPLGGNSFRSGPSIVKPAGTPPGSCLPSTTTTSAQATYFSTILLTYDGYALRPRNEYPRWCLSLRSTFDGATRSLDADGDLTGPTTRQDRSVEC